MAVPPQVTFMTQTARVTLVGSTATNIVTYHFEVVEENGENRRWLCGPSLFGPRTPTFVREIHVTPARWKKVAGILQKTGMDCRDGRNTKRTDPLNVRSVNEMREDSVQIPSGSLSLLILLGPEFRPPQLCCL